ncbi:protein adenylyltransferase SelO [Aliiroseovarius lamellibrachiae]|uniref:protein adenylyltransferase SelO n=1 Tax=Aliiroseovarius lamellibrachiae TaxID=1924933 RepID=UPI001BE0D292|nr:YdiU family protein [Aliiroseovarius lamellibrachiae]MBT2131278.1 YdiU family protein [Aliiroseovarius lamellibrachiae]
MTVTFDNSYARLPDRFYARQTPTPVAAPSTLIVNKDLARELGFDPDDLSAEVLTGDTLLPGTDPIAQVYAGHQFGGWVPRLGDGRACLLGEVTGEFGPNDTRRDVQLKGSGVTPFSRRGDGRAWLGPVMREYLVSEAMHALGIPTTRALGAALTGERVQRERGYPGAILTRVAASHIRVGTFQYFAGQNDIEGLRLLTDYAASRHYPNAKNPMEFLDHVVRAQAKLIAGWMSVGFLHGVMNTDNMAISGETIDYGPCAFLDAYHPRTVFSSIDQTGRYAFAAQPDMGMWNLAQLATALLPLHPDEDAAVEEASAVLNQFPDLFHKAWTAKFRAKLGLTRSEDGDGKLISGLLSRMASSQADFTLTFSALNTRDASHEVSDEGAWDSWAPDWQARLAREQDPDTTMARANPVVIPRNHQIEAAIQAGIDGNYAPFHRLAAAFTRPFAPEQEDMDLTRAPTPDQRVLRTFCGT